MKSNRSVLLLLMSPLLLLLLNGCARTDPAGEDSAPSAQLEASAGGAAYCIECQNGCILGWDFSPMNFDGNHPQGGYRIMLVEGECSCENTGGSWTAVYGWNVTTELGQVGGPGSGSIGSLTGHAWDLWNFNCAGGGGWGGIHLNGDWATWVSDVTHVLEQPDAPHPIGVVAWPHDWGITVAPGPVDGHVNVLVDGAEQAGALSTIRLIETGSGNPIAELPGSGEQQYDLDLNGLPNGAYTFVLEFQPGFELRQPMLKAEPGH